jgi:hypothetical protein
MMPTPTAAATREGTPAGRDAERLRAEQSAAFQGEEFARFFALTQRLAEVSPGYARSYEFHVHAVLRVLAQREPELFFLQVGGMDGKRFDPIYAFVKHHRWKGIILEPLPDLFAALAANYAGHENVALVNAALTDGDGERGISGCGRRRCGRASSRSGLRGSRPSSRTATPWAAAAFPRTCTRNSVVTRRSRQSGA